MQAKKAEALRSEWGDRPCEHPTLAKEYAEGKKTGDYVCAQCGAKITFRERAQIMASRRS
jgi:DNA-directed RNA polymerase subunit RPC12/RpoP